MITECRNEKRIEQQESYDKMHTIAKSFGHLYARFYGLTDTTKIEDKLKDLCESMIVSWNMYDTWNQEDQEWAVRNTRRCIEILKDDTIQNGVRASIAVEALADAEIIEYKLNYILR
ncbi:MAG: hypothetical protein HUJ78_02910 [Mogibacterium sp.]|nr:hypothetical protein [Mogibacterium sp.]MCF0239799.1 hypothetical protein [Streptococcus gallolyticus]